MFPFSFVLFLLMMRSLIAWSWYSDHDPMMIVNRNGTPSSLIMPTIIVPSTFKPTSICWVQRLCVTWERKKEKPQERRKMVFCSRQNNTEMYGLFGIVLWGWMYAGVLCSYLLTQIIWGLNRHLLSFLSRSRSMGNDEHDLLSLGNKKQNSIW